MNREDNDKYIEYLDENGWHLILSDSYKRRKKVVLKKIMLLLMIVVFLNFSSVTTFSKYVDDTSSTANVEVAKWSFKVNSNTNGAAINLADTLVPNSYSSSHVIPGSIGVITFDIDFTDSMVATTYSIEVDKEKSSLPSNLKFYIDEARTKEMIDYTENVDLADVNKVITKKIYWKWVFTDINESPDWSNKDISIVLKVTGQQDV